MLNPVSSCSPQYASGQQCCYDSTGTQVLTGDSTGGSTPDRGHDWGAPPFKRPPRIPGFSHWLYDVISFYYCCLWSGNCHLYMKRRPSSDCRTYRPPRAGKDLSDPLSQRTSFMRGDLPIWSQQHCQSLEPNVPVRTGQQGPSTSAHQQIATRLLWQWQGLHFDSAPRDPGLWVSA